MLTALRTGLRFRVAMTVATFAAFCFVAPPAVLSFGHGDQAVQCLSHADAVNHGMHHAHHGMQKAPGEAQHSDDQAPTTTHNSACCGLFCLSALPPDSAHIIDDLWLGRALSPSPEPTFFSRTPDHPYRPPITLLSV